MSHAVLTGLLRGELGFDNLIVTDALDMAGATSTYPPDVAPVKAVLAGADQLLVPPQMDTAYAAVLDAVPLRVISRHGSTGRCAASCSTSSSAGSSTTGSSTQPRHHQVMGAPQHLATAQAITDRTTTLLKNDDGLLPLATGPATCWSPAGVRPRPDARAAAARGATDAGCSSRARRRRRWRWTPRSRPRRTPTWSS